MVSLAALIVSLSLAATPRTAPLPVSQANPLIRHYDDIVEALFDIGSADNAYVLRYMLSDVEPEMQIVFSVPFDGDCSVRVWHLPEGSEPMFTRLWDMFAAAPSMSPEEALAKMVVSQRTLRFPCDGDVAQLLRRATSLAAPIPDHHTVGIDGVSYRLDAKMGSRQLSYRATGSAIGDPSDDPIVNWMSSVGLAIKDALQ